MREINIEEIDLVSGAGFWNWVGEVLYSTSHPGETFKKTREQLEDAAENPYRL